jgi:predicted negative regulator of RcsB-dependent stress response
MAIELMDEHEQSEVVRKWLKDNVGTMLWGVIGGLLLVSGYEYWQRYARDRQEQAEAQYVSYTQALEKKDESAAPQLAALLRDKFPSSAYASFAALRESEQALAKGDAKAAAADLEFVRGHAKLPELTELATIRLARLQLAQGQADQALKLVGELKPEAYRALALEIKGDALRALKREAEARTAYDDALTVLDSAAPNRSYLEMKRNELGDAPAPAPAPAPTKAGS